MQSARRGTVKAKAPIKNQSTGYNSYRFIDKDPIIDVMRTAFADAKVSYAHVERRSGVTGQTLRAWFEGGTKRPQFASVKAVARALDKDIVLVDRVLGHRH